jgi:hypothetical protein
VIGWQRLPDLVRTTLLQGNEAWAADLQFWHRSEATLALITLVALSLVLLVARAAVGRRAGRHGIVLPALMAGWPRSYASGVRHLPVVLFALGLPCFIVALADPYTDLLQRDVVYPGRRICLMIDASSSMSTPFTAATLNKRAEREPAFFTNVAAAQRFVELRRRGRYRDLLSVIEFGVRAYVVTPFTSDYDNVRLGIDLIGDPVEYARFPDHGTFITGAIGEALKLFDAFDFLDAAGNLMVVFSDGEDTRAVLQGQSLDEVLRAAIESRTPVYFVRTNYGHEQGTVIADELWIAAVRKTGGRFFAVKDEASLLRAIEDVDRVAAGEIVVREYTSQRPRFALFALMAAALWGSAAALKLGVPYLQTLP